MRCPNRINRNVKIEVQAKSNGEHKLLTFITVHTCRQSGARQHSSTTDAGKRDDKVDSGRSLGLFHGGGGCASQADADAPGSNFIPGIILRTNFRPLVLEGIILIFPQPKIVCSLWLERRETKARERRGWYCGSPAGCVYGGFCAAVLPCQLWVECCVRRSWCDT